MTERELFARLDERFVALERLLSEKIETLSRKLDDFKPAECAARGERLKNVERLVFGAIGMAATSLASVMGALIWALIKMVPK